MCSEYFQVDESLLITERLLPAAITHFDSLLRSKQVQLDSPQEQPESPDVWHMASDVQNEANTPVEVTMRDLTQEVLFM